MKTVYFDLETDSLELDCQIIQIAAVASQDFKEVESFERKLIFDIALSKPSALEVNSYREDLWDKEAVPPESAIVAFSDFLKRHADIKVLSSRTNRYYRLAALAAHNAPFDDERIRAFYKRNEAFFPGHYNPTDTIQVAKVLEDLRGKRFESHKLSELSETMGIQHDPTVTHDVLYDARLTMRLHILLLEAIRDTVQRQRSFF